MRGVDTYPAVGYLEESLPASLQNPYFYAFLIFLGLLYLFFLIYLVITPKRVAAWRKRLCGAHEAESSTTAIQ